MTAVRPVLVRPFVVALVTALMVTLLPAAPAAAADSRSPREIRNRIEYLINRERGRRGLSRLRPHDRTQYWARGHSGDMARSGGIYHDGNLGQEVPDRASAYGENVARTSSSDAARDAMSMFMNSTAHRDNILYSRWARMGIGVEKRDGMTYITQRFFAP